ncbi:FPC/CPF motif-containing protein YcgG [Neorhizobium huautlense]|uniref:FPC/CPF motif-containing protein YcgG n=1 Tax=Neorhizobium huautlense TaxID=67774 RepID=A0ABT9PPE4_9HYPH|nr:YqcI/YcgG family protein [Neorhizobium huautlense]MDP9835569.1 FPC/CPF motif-containing protein YcgG [Neorhizobium huautlense]
MFADIAHERRLITPGKMFARRALEDGDAVFSPWQSHAFNDFADRISDESFPCLFGRKAWKAGTIRFVFAECGPGRDCSQALAGLLEYTDFIREVDVSERLLVPLVVFVESSQLADVPHHRLAWDLLNWLHARDPAPWPDGVATAPDDPDWCFCFNGVQLFVNMSTPDHVALRSRNLGQFLTLIINPRENFDVVACADSRSGRLVRDNIRRRVAAYNGGAVPHELGFYGDPDNREWLQYQLEEPGLERPAECPFKPGGDRSAAPSPSIHAPVKPSGDHPLPHSAENDNDQPK